jgi:hypothetical protein
MLEEKPLADAIARFDLLRNYTGRSEDEPVEWETAYAICEVMRSLQKIDKHITSLISASNEDKAGDALHEIREELRHVLYHVHDSAYLSVVSPLETPSPRNAHTQSASPRPKS